MRIAAKRSEAILIHMDACVRSLKIRSRACKGTGMRDDQFVVSGAIANVSDSRDA
jgi:hypothetical protein